jgi:phage shock protein A
MSMNDLLKKLNVLVNSRLNDHSGSPEKPSGLPRNVEGEIEALRGRVNDAVEYEDEIKARIRKFEDEAVRWDTQADDAVTRGDDANARYAIEQMRKAQQRARQAEDDLREHERTTQELIQRVNMLDAVIADARRAQSATPATPTPAEQPAVSDAAKGSVQIPDLSGVLRDAREKIAALADTAAAQLEMREQPETGDAQGQADQGASVPPEANTEVNDDLENRRQRLSKR